MDIQTDDTKYTYPDCKARRDTVKCWRCGKLKRRFRQCSCEEPYVITHKWKPGDPVPMYGDGDDS